ncbi:MAG: metal-sensing transcriptional repressor [Patescibacteria group bacterium]|jgi:hypothetical protein NreA
MHTSRDKVLISLKKANSHLNKVIAMLENNVYCIDIIQQNLAVIGLLKSADHTLMANHLNSCFKTAMKTNNHKKQQTMISEILQVTKLANK